MIRCRHGGPGPNKPVVSLFFLLSLIFHALPALAQKAIDFTLKDLEGNPVTLSDFRGTSIVLVDFWATWCVPCVKELTHFQRFHDLYKDKGLVILAITVDGPESVAMIRPFVERYRYTFPVLLDTESKVIALYNPRVVMPYTFLVDKKGVIRYTHQGYSLGDEKILEEEILKLLAGEEEEKKESPLSLQGTEALLYRYFSDEEYVDTVRDGRSSQLINQLDFTLSSGRFLGGIRIDTYLDFSPWQDDFSLAKKFVAYESKNLKMRAGDFYYTQGRGLSFSLLKTFEQEGLEYIIDTTVEGGKVGLAGGPVSAEIFGGWVRRDKPPHGTEETIRDRVYGGTLGWRFKGFADVKVNLFGSSLEPGTLLGTRTATMESFSLDIPNWRDKLRFYGEFLLVQKYQHYSEDRIRGHGIYVETGLFLQNWTFLVEFKDYRNLDFEYNRPPLLETEQLPIVANQFVDSADDVIGVSGRVDYFLPQVSTLLFGKATYQTDRRELASRDIFHTFVGYEKKFKETGWLTLIAGVRREKSPSLVFWDTAGRTYHGQGNLSYPLDRRLSLEVNFEIKQFRGDLDFGGQFFNYEEHRSYFSLHSSPRWILTLLYDRTTDPKILTFKDKRNWWGGQLEIKFGRHAVRIFYGSNKGGVKCAGGVCRFFPPFEGLRIDGLFRF